MIASRPPLSPVSAPEKSEQFFVLTSEAVSVAHVPLLVHAAQTSTGLASFNVPLGKYPPDPVEKPPSHK